MSKLYLRPKAGGRAGTLPRAPFARAERKTPRLLDPATQPQGTRLPWPVATFLVSLIIPWIVPVGPLSLAPYRAVLMVALLPCLVMWLSGRAGRIRPADIGLILFCLWAWISIAVNHGLSAATEPGGILFVETIGAYLLARCYIRDADDFRNVTNLMVKFILLLFPFAVYEWITGSKPILSAFGAIFPTVEITLNEPRWGFRRVQGPFIHPIMFGLFCGSLFALTHFVADDGRTTASRRWLTAVVAGSVVLSMSSAPIAGLVLQVAMISWNWLLRQYESRWKILWGLLLAGYVVVELGSNQTPIQFYIHYFTFDKETGWFRLYIWEFGSASVRNHPLFGIGFNDWVRPKWMVPDSVDNFWLLTAMRHGMPALSLMLGSYLWIVIKVASKKIRDERLQNYRIAYLICMITFFIGATTVHLWTAAYVWFLFLMGSGVWFFDTETGDSAAARASRSRHRSQSVRRTPTPAGCPNQKN